MVPKNRDADARHEVATYDTVNASVRAYMKNLNTSDAYDDLRDMRWLARLRGVHPEAIPVSAGLAPYSERGKAYVADIQAMIRKNRDLMIESTAGDS
jgi:Bax protein